MTVFGRRLRALRKSRGLTQEQLGRAVGMDYKHIGRLERGEFGASFEAVQKFAEALRVDYYELFLPPDRGATDKMEQSLAAAIKNISGPDRLAVEQFLLEVLGAARRLQAGGRSDK